MSTIQITVDESIGKLLGESPEQIERSALEIIVLDLGENPPRSAPLHP